MLEPVQSEKNNYRSAFTIVFNLAMPMHLLNSNEPSVQRGIARSSIKGQRKH